MISWSLGLQGESPRTVLDLFLDFGHQPPESISPSCNHRRECPVSSLWMDGSARRWPGTLAACAYKDLQDTESAPGLAVSMTIMSLRVELPVTVAPPITCFLTELKCRFGWGGKIAHGPSAWTPKQ